MRRIWLEILLPECKPVKLALMFLILFATTTSSSFAEELTDYPNVTTLAGSGRLGIADGAPSVATFVAPVGVAYAADGRLYVADRDAQRIRVVARDGSVTTLAGSAPLVQLGLGAGGAFRDGPAKQAFFNMPSAVQPMPDGGVLVADTGNYCIRRIRNGVVDTYAGDRTAGLRDGRRDSARFAHPMALVLDKAQNVYVADPPNGLRRIDRRGNVVTLNFPDSDSVISVAVPANDAGKLIVASSSLIQRLDLATLQVDRPFPLAFPYDVTTPRGFRVNREGLTNTGPAAAIAAFRDDDFVYVDPLASAVRFGQTELGGPTTINYSRSLTATPPENASLGLAGFQDGTGVNARVDEPLGVTIGSDGSIAVADTGNRRIRLLSTFNHRTHLSTDALGTEFPPKPDAKEFRIAVLGNSYIWWNQGWNDSIPGGIEDRLLRSAHSSRQPRIIPIMRQGLPTLGALQYVRERLSDGLVDMVIIDIGTYGQSGGDGFAGPAFPSGWQAALRDALSETRQVLARAKVAVLLVDFPGASDFADEFAYARVPKGPRTDAAPSLQNQPTNVQYYHDEIAAILSASGMQKLDLWPAFLDAYGQPRREPLFATWDHHLSPFGRSLVASNIADWLLRSHPWDGGKGDAAVRR